MKVFMIAGLVSLCTLMAHADTTSKFSLSSIVSKSIRIEMEVQAESDFGKTPLYVPACVYIAQYWNYDESLPPVVIVGRGDNNGLKPNTKVVANHYLVPTRSIFAPAQEIANKDILKNTALDVRFMCWGVDVAYYAKVDRQGQLADEPMLPAKVYLSVVFKDGDTHEEMMRYRSAYLREDTNFFMGHAPVVEMVE